MTTPLDIDRALRKLQFILDEQRNNPDTDFLDITTHREEVLDRFQPIFQPSHIPDLTAEEFEILFSHTTIIITGGCNEQEHLLPGICGYSAKHSQYSPIESAHISVRMNRLRMNYHSADNSMVPNLGIPYITGILLFTHPDKYGVWKQNNDGGYG